MFTDSFNQTDTLAQKWDFAGIGFIINNPAIARTGPRCMQLTGGSIGPSKNIGPGLQVVQYTKLIQGVACNFDSIASPIDILAFNVVGAFVQDSNVIVGVNPDGSISAYRGAGDGPRTLLATSASKPFAFTTVGVNNLWNYVECKTFINHTTGTVEVRFAPPGGPMTVLFSLVGQNTTAFAAAPFTNQVQLFGPGGLAQHSYLADYYCNDWSDGSGYRGGVHIFAGVPFANGAPVQFTPLSGANWQNVDEIPPDLDTSYNASGTVGAVDQYQHNAGVIPVGSQIQAIQHTITAETDTGARAITSVVGGVVNPLSVYLPNLYGMYQWPYDTYPVTGLAWRNPLDFPAQFGIEVTA